MTGRMDDPRDTDRGWSVEVAFPWPALRKFAGERSCPPSDGDCWRVNFSRVHWLADIIEGRYRKIPREAHPEDNWVWTPQDAIDMHRPERWGYVEFATEAREPRRDETWPARELLMDLYYQHRAGAEEFVFRGVRAPSLSHLRFEQDPWRASIECAGRRVEVDATGRLRVVD